MSESDQTQVVNVVFCGRWRLDGRIGVGGMGSVLRGTDLTTQDSVAIKTLGVHLVDNPEFVKRFEREALLLSKLTHPALPPFLALDRHEGMPFFVMKLVEGRTLGSLLAERKKLLAAEAMGFVRQLAEVLEYLHSRGVVHRDLKPDNVIIDGTDRLSLVDFGISAETGATRLTLPGIAVGTPLYMAPEQITSGQAVTSSDIYSLGLLTFTMVAGEHPFAREDRAGMLTRQVNEIPRAVNLVNPTIPEAVAAVLSRALDKSPSARFQSALEFVDALTTAYGVDRTPDADSTDKVLGNSNLPPTVAMPRRSSQQAVELAKVKAKVAETRPDLSNLKPILRDLGPDERATDDGFMRTVVDTRPPSISAANIPATAVSPRSEIVPSFIQRDQRNRALVLGGIVFGLLSLLMLYIALR